MKARYRGPSAPAILPASTTLSSTAASTLRSRDWTLTGHSSSNTSHLDKTVLNSTRTWPLSSRSGGATATVASARFSDSPRGGGSDPSVSLKSGHMALTHLRTMLDDDACADDSWTCVPALLSRDDDRRRAKELLTKVDWQRTPRAGPSKSQPLYRDPSVPVKAGKAGGSFISLDNYKDDSRDWRKLSSTYVTEHFEGRCNIFQKSIQPRLYQRPPGRDATTIEQHEGLMTAIAVGTLQAINEGFFWAPSFQHPAAVRCNGVRTPLSRLFKNLPDLSNMEFRSDESSVPDILALPDLDPIAACQRCREGGHARVAVVRFTAAGDNRDREKPALGDHREQGLLLRTTYFKALQDMPRHIHGCPSEAVEEGGLIYTPDVAILRGPLESGALWLAEPSCVDVIWVALQRNPRCDDQGQYARVSEKARMVESIDMIFACAAAHDVDTLIFPPPGLANSGCHHPAADSGDLIRKAAYEYARHIPRVRVCREYGEQVGASWSTFAAAVSGGREPIQHRELVPLTVSPYIRPGWEDKPPRARKIELGHRPRPERPSFL